MGAQPARSDQARLTALIEPVVADAGYDLEQVDISKAGRRSVVRVIVDKDGGVSLDDIADVSRAVSAALDAADEDGFAGRTPYTLEVTSPGVDRPLTEPRHWRRAVGRLVSVPVGDETVTGRVVEVDGSGVVLEVDGGRRGVDFGRLGSGKVQVEFGRKEAGR